MGDMADDCDIWFQDEWSPEDHDDDVWVTAQGRAIPIVNMETSHLLNTLNYIDRRRCWEEVGANRLVYLKTEARKRGVQYLPGIGWRDTSCFEHPKIVCVGFDRNMNVVKRIVDNVNHFVLHSTQGRKKMNKFWILWSPQSRLPPTKKFDTEKEALDVADIMARRYPAQEFYVCSAVAHARVSNPPVKITRVK